MNSILVATDLGSSSVKVVAAAVELAQALDTDIMPIHVLTPERVEDYRASVPAESAFIDVLRARLASDVDNQFAGAARLMEPRVEIGEAASTLLAKAEELAASYLVIGIRNRSRVGKLIMGSVAQEILLAAPCPVVGIPV